MLLNSVTWLLIAAGTAWGRSVKTVEYTVQLPVWDLSQSYSRIVNVFRGTSNRWSVYRKQLEDLSDYNQNYYYDSPSWSNTVPLFPKTKRLLLKRKLRTTTTTTQAPVTMPTQETRNLKSYDQPMTKSSQELGETSATETQREKG